MNESNSLHIALGTRVDLELIDENGGREPLTVELVADRAADFANGRLGEGTPLAQAILGQRAGATVQYTLGDIQKVRVIAVQWGNAQLQNERAAEEAARRRQAELQKALDAAEQTSAQMFASSFSGKWGDYDPKGIDAWQEKASKPDA